MIPASRSSLWALLVTQGVLAAGMALSFPFLALYLHRNRGLSMDAVGAILSLVFVMSAVGQMLSGELSDIWGCKRVMVLAVGLRGLTAAVMAAAMLRGWPVAALAALNMLSSFFGSFFDPAIRSWMAERYPARERLQAYGRLRVAVNLGWAVGPALGGLVAEQSYPMMFAATAAVCLSCMAMIERGVFPSRSSRAESRFSLREVLSTALDGRFIRFCGFGIMIALVMAQLVVSLSVHSVNFVHLTERHVGFLFATNALVVILMQQRMASWLSRTRMTTALAAGSFLYAAGYYWVGFAAGFSGLCLAVIVVSFGEIVVSPGLHALAANLAPDRFQGRYLGFYGLMQQLGAALGPLAGGLGLRYLSPRWSPAPWIAVAALALASGAGFYRFGRLVKVEEQGLY